MSSLDSLLGKHVQCIVNVGGIAKEFLVGTLCKEPIALKRYYLRLDKPHPDAHSCSNQVPHFYGWYVNHLEKDHFKVLAVTFNPLSEKIKYLNKRYTDHAKSRNLPTQSIYS